MTVVVRIILNNQTLNMDSIRLDMLKQIKFVFHLSIGDTIIPYDRIGQVKVVPYNYDFTKEVYDGLFISNGPGNPTLAHETIKNIRYVRILTFIIKFKTV